MVRGSNLSTRLLSDYSASPFNSQIEVWLRRSILLRLYNVIEFLRSPTSVYALKGEVEW